MNWNICTIALLMSLAAFSLHADSSLHIYKPLSQEQLQPEDENRTQHHAFQAIALPEDQEDIRVNNVEEKEQSKVIRFMNASCGCFLVGVFATQVSAALLVTHQLLSI